MLEYYMQDKNTKNIICYQSGREIYKLSLEFLTHFIAMGDGMQVQKHLDIKESMRIFGLFWLLGHSLH